MIEDHVLINVSKATSLRLAERVVKVQDGEMRVLTMDRVITDLLDVADSEGQ
jgi:hypothetical protein